MDHVREEEFGEVEIDEQMVDLARINETLKRYGIVDQEMRKEICCDYVFGNAYFFDEGWFLNSGKSHQGRDFIEVRN